MTEIKVNSFLFLCPALPAHFPCAITMANNTSSSRRFQLLLDVLDLAFAKSEKYFNVEQAIK